MKIELIFHVFIFVIYNWLKKLRKNVYFSNTFWLYQLRVSSAQFLSNSSFNSKILILDTLYFRAICRQSATCVCCDGLSWNWWSFMDHYSDLFIVGGKFWTFQIFERWTVPTLSNKWMFCSCHVQHHGNTLATRCKPKCYDGVWNSEIFLDSNYCTIAEFVLCKFLRLSYTLIYVANVICICYSYRL